MGEVNTHKIIRIFLASSIDDLLQENFLHGENCLAEEIVGPLILLSESKQIDEDLRKKVKEHCSLL